MRTHTQVSFDGLERKTLQRLLPLIRVAYPSDEIDWIRQKIGEAEALGEDVQTRRILYRDLENASREFEGRHLTTVCRGDGQFSPVQIHEAWRQCVELGDVLAEQATVDYWSSMLDGPDPLAGGPLASLSPTRMCEVLAGEREVQVRLVEDALELLAQARVLVGES